MEDMKLVKIFKALGDPNRVKIVKILDGGERCACNLLDELEMKQPTVSHHMKILCESGLLKCRKEGKWNHYSVNKETFELVEKFFNEIGKDN